MISFTHNRYITWCRRLGIWLLLLLPLVSRAQTDTLGGPVDSIRYLTEAQFLAIVKQHHPVARQAEIEVEMADASLTAARAPFDPYFSLYASQKTFDGRNYYNYVNPEVTIPTWYGVELFAGLENNGGELLANESTPGKSSYIGISVPLAKDLIIDKRRAALRQAKLFREQSRADQRTIMNDLLMEAISAYWDWAGEYYTYQVLQNAATVNRNRLQLIRLSVIQGDRAAVDTVEAWTQLQTFQLLATESLMRFLMAGNELANYLWWEGQTPLGLPANARPDSSWLRTDPAGNPVPVLDDLLTQAMQQHPKLLALNVKLRILDIDKQLKFQDLLPYVNLKGFILSKEYSFFKDWSSAYIENNNRFGIDIGVPLRLSAGRGNYRLARLKIEQTDLERVRQQVEIQNKVKQYFNEWAGNNSQSRIAEDAYVNYEILFRAEEMKFRAGESSLFLLNSRETKMLEARQKWIELLAKTRKAYAGTLWSSGLLF